jgi:hypothetical protein
MTLRRICPALLVVGVGLMVPFEETITLALGVVCLVGFVVTGVFAVATPEFLGGDEHSADFVGKHRQYRFQEREAEGGAKYPS